MARSRTKVVCDVEGSSLDQSRSQTWAVTHAHAIRWGKRQDVQPHRILVLTAPNVRCFRPPGGCVQNFCGVASMDAKAGKRETHHHVTGGGGLRGGGGGRGNDRPVRRRGAQETPALSHHPRRQPATWALSQMFAFVGDRRTSPVLRCASRSCDWSSHGCPMPHLRPRRARVHPR